MRLLLSSGVRTVRDLAILSEALDIPASEIIARSGLQHELQAVEAAPQGDHTGR